MCVMCSTSVPTLFQYFFYDHIPIFLYIFHEMFFTSILYIIAIYYVIICNILFYSSFLTLHLLRKCGVVYVLYCHMGMSTASAV